MADRAFLLVEVCCFLLIAADLSWSSKVGAGDYAELERQQSQLCERICLCDYNQGLIDCNRQDQLRAIPRRIAPQLIHVTIQHAQFVHPVLQRENFTQLNHIRKLVVIYSGLKAIRSMAFAALNQLEYLDLSNNALAQLVPDTFYGLTLRQLYLQNNPSIQLTTQSFRGLRTERLYMRQNRLRVLHFRTFASLGLQQLYLSNNRIRSLDPQFRTLFTSADQELDLTANPLHCSCQLAWLAKFLQLQGQREKSATSNVNITCASPPELRGRQLLSLTSKRQLPCPEPRIKAVYLDLQLPSAAELVCSAVGYPAPKIAWSYYQSHLGLQEVRRTPDPRLPPPPAADQSPDSQLLLESRISLNVSLSSVRREYTCTAWNTEELGAAGGKEKVTVFLRGPPPTVWPDKKYNPGPNQGQVQPPVTDSPPRGNNNPPGIYSDKSFIFRKQFTLLEMIGAVVGTFTATLALLLGVTWCVAVFKKRREKKKKASAAYWGVGVGGGGIGMPGTGSAYSGTGSHEYDVPRIDHPPPPAYPPPPPRRSSNDIEFLDFKNQRLLYNVT